MMREGSHLIISEIAKLAISKGYCPSCGLHKDFWLRTKSYRCCSKKCTEIFYEIRVIATSWNDFRFKIFQRDGYNCRKCKCIFVSQDLVCDHIVPIALGGPQWDMKNCQTLCKICNKKKTRQDHHDIANNRRIKKKLRCNKVMNFMEMLRDAIKEGELRTN